MNELSTILLPWLKKHGYKITNGGSHSDFLEINDKDLKIAYGTDTTVGWVYADHVEIGTKLHIYDSRGDLATWHGSEYVILKPAEPEFFAKLLVALGSASKVAYDFDAIRKQAKDFSLSQGRH